MAISGLNVKTPIQNRMYVPLVGKGLSLVGNASSLRVHVQL